MTKLQVENTAQAYLELLRLLGVEYFFGNPGTDFASIIDAFAKFAVEGKTAPRPIAVPHEYCAVSMAHGYTMVTGKPQAVMVHTTVGTANALGALINASRSNIPLLLSAGRSPITEQGVAGNRDTYIHWAQESFDQGAMVREYVKWDYELKNFSQLETVVRRALTLAMSEPQGPVYLTLPREILAEAQSEIVVTDSPLSPAAAPYPDPEKIQELAGAIARAEHPLIITRNLGREPQAVASLTQLAELFALPVIEFPVPQYTNFPTAHPLHLGFEPGPSLSDADLILVIECDVPWIPSQHKLNPKARVVHIGVDPLHHRYPIWGFPAETALVAGPEIAMRLLCQALAQLRPGKEAKIVARFERLRQEHERQRENRQQEALRKGEAAKITLEWATHCLNQFQAEELMIINEYDLSLRHCELRRPGNYFCNSPAGSLGWGVGAALGVKLAAPDKTVVAVVGDGSYIFSVPSACHMVSAMQQLPILVIVCDNGGWNSPQKATRAVHPKGWAVRTEHFPLTRFTVQPAYEMFVQAYGGYGVRVTEPKEVPSALAKAMKVVKEEKRQAVVHLVCESIIPAG
ncbi:thiamine pyrophosphate-requiring protein [bacterium]|nr:MAG: thiamine pyrophosphate-requiring protein [bacterium]